MVKKSLIAGLTAIILSLCCGLCFAAEGDNQNSINLGNEITKSIDKAGQSMENVTSDVFSRNVINNTRNGVMNVGNDITTGMNNVDNGVVNTTENRNTGNNNNNNAGDYDVTRTTAEGTATGITTMSTTTWMWIILAVAAIIIIAAVWYYATQNNE